MTEQKRGSFTAADGILMVVALTVAVGVVMWLMVIILASPSAADYRKACARHEGAQQIVGAGIPPTEPAMVVCRDGWVTHV